MMTSTPSSLPPVMTRTPNTSCERSRREKHVFVEKPLCRTSDELEEIQYALQSRHLGNGRPCPQIMVGFNRRFAPHAVALKASLQSVPLSMVYRVNAGKLPSDHWVHDPEIAGGRIVGEGCHFIDFLVWLCGALPTSIHAVTIPDPQGHQDTSTITLQFADGSIGTVCYFANGSSSLEKEYIEVHQAGRSAILRDFKQLELYGKGKPQSKKSPSQDKGQRHMVRAFLERAKNGGPPLIPTREILAVSRCCFAAQQSLRTREDVLVDIPRD